MEDAEKQDEPIPYPSPPLPTSHLPAKYGSYHLLYKVDSQIIGISVIDILPKCVSSVYFIWDPNWAWASLGKLSALWEASLARRISEALGGGDGSGGWVYMGESSYLSRGGDSTDMHSVCTAQWNPKRED